MKRMAVRNKIKKMLDERGDTRYKFWKKTELAQNTAYKLYDKPEQIPTAHVLDRICEVYGVQPGDILEHIPNSNLETAA